MAVGRRACPWRRLRRRSTSWSSSASDYTTRTLAPSRLKQIDWRSCTGNVNLLKLGGRAARPLRGFAATKRFASACVAVSVRLPPDPSRLTGQSVTWRTTGRLLRSRGRTEGEKAVPSGLGRRPSRWPLARSCGLVFAWCVRPGSGTFARLVDLGPDWSARSQIDRTLTWFARRKQASRSRRFRGCRTQPQLLRLRAPRERASSTRRSGLRE
jgi:hypothetical protein